uniref:Uncharacterized protein TCIL3000_7_1250 n=1 Tax=Trypanosoma congolense (strain IL3000) TaxID=1068625 RepID=G0UPL0_TRYCI|nr:unnamed protein product [Trypanosoma congolense IL3000]
MRYLLARALPLCCVLNHRLPLLRRSVMRRSVESRPGVLGTVCRSMCLGATGQKPVVVESSETPNPNCLRFYSMELSFLPPGRSLELPDSQHAFKSPLAEMLFGIEGVVSVFVADEYITLGKASHVGWDELVPRIRECIIEFAESGMAVLSEEGEACFADNNNDTEPEEDDDEVVLAVKELLSTRIRPLLQSDGGNVRYIDMDDGTVFVLLEGACKSCPSSGATLKNGIERMLMHWIPEVVEVQECSDEMASDLLAQKELRKKTKSSEAAVSST